MPFAMIKLPFSLANVNRDTREMEGTALVNITFVFCLSTIYNINRETHTQTKTKKG